MRPAHAGSDLSFRLMGQAHGSVLLTGLRLKNVRGFRDLDVRMTAGGDGAPRPITLVIGKNGTNKSTLLRAIALCLADPTEASSMLSQPIGSMVRAGAEVATIEVDVVGPAGEARQQCDAVALDVAAVSAAIGLVGDGQPQERH